MLSWRPTSVAYNGAHNGGGNPYTAAEPTEKSQSTLWIISEAKQINARDSSAREELHGKQKPKAEQLIGRNANPTNMPLISKGNVEVKLDSLYANKCKSDLCSRTDGEPLLHKGIVDEHVTLRECKVRTPLHALQSQ
ncbi:hypothetical protein KIN20_005231 [Parelaphostrongylus tenuis]|uniref:Uncharacterized protein n=1 Tax=Parelaphostrongylus tenuis TaxID=148309 RepID=A0AAD5M017_PARTN|nr:hypothetical protein KIN20_005231 [Parelaphostrongylus tenuis]